MATPSQSQLHRPILEILSNAAGPMRRSELASAVAGHLGLSEADLAERTRAGGQTKFANRMSWATMRLNRAGALEYHTRGSCAILPAGRQLLEREAGDISAQVLDQMAGIPPHDLQDTYDSSTPDEIMEAAHREMQDSLADELLKNLRQVSPARFEQLAVELFGRMGYGQGETTGRSGDGGIDGIISQDPLGLERVYIQAKRYADNRVGSSEISNFTGGLDTMGVHKGVFITTADFTTGARQTATESSKLILLVNGPELARLMMQHGVGVITKHTYPIQQLDENYFPSE